ncbi:MAG TPA: ATP-binding protein [Thermoanaerobaculia bacterium]|nr:ATP-binding protein [Thermoanaerobaculia bacterium]
MLIPRTIPELQALVANKVQESLHLDYKSRAVFDKKIDHVRTDLAKDVSAFANSDGGMLVFGIEERDSLPTGLDIGVDHTAWTRERIEGILTSNISPRIDGMEIVQIPASVSHSYFVIVTQRSSRGPHQETIEHRYYKRFNFKSQPMEDYEIRDVRNRRDVVLPLVSVDVDIRHGVLLELVVTNIGDIAAENVRFRIEPAIDKLSNAKLLTDGSKWFPPGKCLRFFIGSAIEKVRKEGAPRFDVTVTYFNRRADQNVTDIFHIDMSDYLWSAIVNSDIDEHSTKLQESLGKVTSELEKLNRTLERLSTIAGATGLDLSLSTVRNLAHVVAAEPQMQRLRANGLGWEAFAEALGIDREMAFQLHTFATWGQGDRLEDIENLPPEIAAKARAMFIFDDEERASG